MGSDKSHLTLSVGIDRDGQSHKKVSTNHNLFEEKGEPKWYRTEVLPLTSLTPYRLTVEGDIAWCQIYTRNNRVFQSFLFLFYVSHDPLRTIGVISPGQDVILVAGGFFLTWVRLHLPSSFIVA